MSFILITTRPLKIQTDHLRPMAASTQSMSLSCTYRRSDTTSGLYVLFYIDLREEMGRGTQQCSEMSELGGQMSDAALEKQGGHRRGVPSLKVRGIWDLRPGMCGQGGVYGSVVVRI